MRVLLKFKSLQFHGLLTLSKKNKDQAMSYVTVDIRDTLAILTINRPEKKNALNEAVRRDLYTSLKKVEFMPEIRVVVITGAGDTFVAGADIAPMVKYNYEDALKASQNGSEIYRFIEVMKKIVIAVINGWALGGGCELAIACDLRICSDDAKLGLPEVKIGLIPGYGAIHRLPRLVGLGNAKELIYSGRIISANEAKEIGMINYIFPKEQFMEKAIDLAAKYSNGPAAIGIAKLAFKKLIDEDSEKMIKFTSKYYAQVHKTSDAKEGIRAYIDKRKPDFKGK